MKTPFKVIQFGMCHEHANGKMCTLRHFSDEFEVIGVVDDRSSGSAKTRITDFSTFDGIPILTEEEALSSKDAEAMLIEVTNGDLVPFAMKCAERGFPMHMDKPTGEEERPFIELVELCRKKRIHLQLGYMFRDNPAVKFTHKAVREGWLGDLVSAEADMNHSYGDLPYQEYLSAFKAGILYTLGCHMVDLFMPLFNWELPLRAHPVLKTAVGDRDGIPNTCVSVMEWPHATATMHASSRAKCAQAIRRFRVLGTKGLIEICPIERFDNKPLKLRMTLSEAAGGYEAGDHEVDFGVIEDRYVGQLRELRDIVRGVIPDPDNYDHDIAVHRAVLKACGLD